SEAIALPRPVPAPVMNTSVPSKVPAGNADAPRPGGGGSPGSSLPLMSDPGMSAPCVVAGTALAARGAQLGHVVGPAEIGLVDQLVVHRRPYLGAGEVADDHPRQLDRGRW